MSTLAQIELAIITDLLSRNSKCSTYDLLPRQYVQPWTPIIGKTMTVLEVSANRLSLIMSQ